MIGTIDSKTLADQLRHFKRILPRQSGEYSVLELVFGDDGARLTASNGETDLQISLPAAVQESGKAYIPAHTFAEVVKVLGAGEAEIAARDSALTVKSGGASFDIPTVADTGLFVDFPSAPATLQMPTAAFQAALERVRYAASTETFTNIFRGVYCAPTAQGGRLVASDGYRVGIADFTPADGEVFEAVIPQHALVAAASFFGKDGNLSFLSDGQKITVWDDKTRVSLKVMDGSFPDYQRSIPEEFMGSFTVDSDELKAILAKLSVLTDKNNNHRVSVDVSEREAVLSVSGPSGRAEAALPLAGGGFQSPVRISFNAAFLREAIDPIAGPVKISVASESRPALIEPAEPNGYTAVLVVLKP